MEELSEGHIAGWFPAAAERAEVVISGGSWVCRSLEAFLSISLAHSVRILEEVAYKFVALKGWLHAIVAASGNGCLFPDVLEA